MARYYSLNDYLKDTYGEKIYKLSLSGNMTCPNRDGTIGSSGCIFCSEGGSGDFAASSALLMEEQIQEAKERISGKVQCKHFIAYFQAFTNTYASISYLKNLFTPVVEREDIIILSIATRPDCIDDKVIHLLSQLNRTKEVWVELGYQTMHETSHTMLRTGFSLKLFQEVVHKLHHAGIKVIAHVILGLPGENKEMMLQSVDYLTSLPIWGIKLQLLHVLNGTILGEMYQSQPFPTLSLEEYTDLIVECIQRIPPEMVIHRMTGDGPKSLLIAPLWSQNKRLVLNTIHKKLKEQDTYQGKEYNNGRTKYTI